MKIISTQTAEHYSWGQNCDGWHLLRSNECSVIRERMPPQTSEVEHFHNVSRQFFYVLSGTLSIIVQGERQVLSSEQGLEIPPRVRHRVINDTDSDVQFIVVSAPPSHGDRVVTA
jgi:mannose-6-phosphate isomerase-like protein (cupin superfamily)